MTNKVSLDDLADAVVAEFQSYARNLDENLQNDIKQIAKEAVSEVKSKSPKKSGKYKSGWTSKVTEKRSGVFVVTIYNKNKPQLAHLLEFGHAKLSGGRTNGKPHIKPAEERANTKLIEKIKTEARQ